MHLPFIKQIFRKLTKRESKEKLFPYEWKNPEYPVVFKINNFVEEFRLRQWGGEKEYSLEIYNELSDDDTFFDIGSSVGLNSILAANKLKNGKVVSFEPDPENIQRLQENYRINNLKNCVIQQIAVGKDKSKMKLFTAGSNGYSPSLQKVNGIDSFVEVEVNTIDNLLDSGEIPYPSVIKIDIEGAEMMALEGMRKLLKSRRRPRVIFIEIHPEFLGAFNTSIEEIFTFLTEFDYTIAVKKSQE